MNDPDLSDQTLPSVAGIYQYCLVIITWTRHGVTVGVVLHHKSLQTRRDRTYDNVKATSRVWIEDALTYMSMHPRFMPVNMITHEYKFVCHAHSHQFNFGVTCDNSDIFKCNVLKCLYSSNPTSLYNHIEQAHDCIGMSRHNKYNGILWL